MSLKVIEIDPNYNPTSLPVQGGGGIETTEARMHDARSETTTNTQHDIQQSGGSFNPENLELDLEEFDFQETGNPNDPTQDAPAPDDKEIDLVEKGFKDEEADPYGHLEEERENANYLMEDDEQEEQDPISEPVTSFTSHWRHPELGLDSVELSSHLNQEQIQNQVNYYIANYYSVEYQEYLDKLNYVYSKVGKKFYIRRDKKGNLYLMGKTNEEAKKKDYVPEKSLQELEDQYLIKLEPPKYISVKKTLELLDIKLRRASVKIRNLQNELLSKGGDITDKDVDRFKRKKRQFFQLVNRKQIYINYYYEVNNINVDDDKIKWNAKRMIERENNDGEKMYSYESLLVNLSEETVEQFKEKFREQLDIYSEIFESFNQLNSKERQSNPEYDSLIKDYLKKNDKLNQYRHDKVKEGIVKEEDKIDFLVDELPVIHVRKNL